MATKADRDFLADVNQRLGTDYKTVTQYLTDNGKRKKNTPGYARRQTELENWRGRSQRRQMVLSGKLVEEAKKLYGSVADMYNIPELRSIFEDGFINQWTSDELLRAIDNTEWAKTRTLSQERYDVLKTTNPIEAAAEVDQNIPTVRRILSGKGISLGEDQIKVIAEKGARNGWSNVEWDEYVASEAIALTTAATPAQTPTRPASTVTPTNLRVIAKQFGVPIAEATLNQWSNDIATNRKTEDQFTEYARASAQTLYPGLAERLKTNTFDEITSPYKRLYAEVLETPEDNIDLTAPQFSTLFTGSDPANPRMMTSTEWVGFLRRRPEWQNTQNAYREYAQVSDTLNKIFGGTR